MLALSLSAVIALVPAVLGAQAPQFAPAAVAPLASSTNYTGVSNDTLAKQDVVKGKAFDRFIQVCTYPDSFTLYKILMTASCRFGLKIPTTMMLLPPRLSRR